MLGCFGITPIKGETIVLRLTSGETEALLLFLHSSWTVRHMSADKTCPPAAFTHAGKHQRPKSYLWGISKLPDSGQNKSTSSEEMILLIRGMCAKGGRSSYQKHYFSWMVMWLHHNPHWKKKNPKDNPDRQLTLKTNVFCRASSIKV